LNAIARAIIGFFDLIEAEGRELRRIASFALLGAAILLLAGATAIIGFTFVAAAFYHFLLPMAGVTAALLATGAFGILVSIALFYLGFRSVNSNFTRKEAAGDERAGEHKEAPDAR
jgi:hypothetical protein